MNLARFRKWKLFAAIIVAAFIAGKSPAQPPSPSPEFPEKDYELTIDGTAPMVGRWSCGGNAKVEAKPSRMAESGPGLNAETQTVMVTASVPAIECGDAKMNEYLRSALKMNDFGDQLPREPLCPGRRRQRRQSSANLRLPA
jgi:hypothetical protein